MQLLPKYGSVVMKCKSIAQHTNLELTVEFDPSSIHQTASAQVHRHVPHPDTPLTWAVGQHQISLSTFALIPAAHTENHHQPINPIQHKPKETKTSTKHHNIPRTSERQQRARRRRADAQGNKKRESLVRVVPYVCIWL